VLLTTRMPQHRVSWVMAIAALWWGILGLAQAYAVEALVEDPGALPGGLAAAWFNQWGWLPGLALFLCALLVLMPDGGLPSRRWWPAPVSVAIGTVLASSFVAAESSFDLAGTPVSNPLASNSSVLGVAGFTGTVLVIAGLVASLAAFVLRYRRSEGERRQQLRWVVVSFGLAVSLAVAGALAWGVVPGAAALPALALLALPAGIAVAVLKYRLYELDLVVNRAIVYVLSAPSLGPWRSPRLARRHRRRRDLLPAAPPPRAAGGQPADVRRAGRSVPRDGRARPHAGELSAGRRSASDGGRDDRPHARAAVRRA
jgi:hypothetical protein